MEVIVSHPAAARAVVVARAADEAFTRLLPRTIDSPLTAYDSLCLCAGRSAADAATLDVRDSIAG